jgi:hypothetical protein
MNNITSSPYAIQTGPENLMDHNTAGDLALLVLRRAGRSMELAAASAPKPMLQHAVRLLDVARLALKLKTGASK